MKRQRGVKVYHSMLSFVSTIQNRLMVRKAFVKQCRGYIAITQLHHYPIAPLSHCADCWRERALYLVPIFETLPGCRQCKFSDALWNIFATPTTDKRVDQRNTQSRMGSWRVNHPALAQYPQRVFTSTHDSQKGEVHHGRSNGGQARNHLNVSGARLHSMRLLDCHLPHHTL